MKLRPKLLLISLRLKLIISTPKLKLRFPLQFVLIGRIQCNPAFVVDKLRYLKIFDQPQVNLRFCMYSKKKKQLEVVRNAVLMHSIDIYSFKSNNIWRNFEKSNNFWRIF